MEKQGRRLLLALFGIGALALVGITAPKPAALAAPAAAETNRVRPERVVFVGGQMADLDLISFTVNAAGSGHPGVVLLDGPRSSRGLRGFLAAFGPDQVIPIGHFPLGQEDLAYRLGVKLDAPLVWQHGPGEELWKTWFPRAEQVVVCPPHPRRLLLEAGCLAGTMKAPLWIVRDGHDEFAELRKMLTQWQTRRVLAVGTEPSLAQQLPGVHIVELPNEAAVAALHRRQLQQHGSINTLVVANPADTRRELHGMSALAPFLALQHHAALLLTDGRGDNTAEVVQSALEDSRLRAADYLLLAADLEAIPMEKRVNPVPGKDTHIEMEPLTPDGAEPFSFAVGRLFHDDAGVILLMQARQRLLADQARQPNRPRKALVVSNPGGGLPLLELFSRNTVQELNNCGYETRAMFGEDVTRADVRRLLPQNDIFLWEGHHSTLIKDYGFAEWTEPLPPSLTFLQSCLALTDAKTHHLLERGSVAVVGSSTRIYSATGGAFSLAYFNALLYDGQSIGASLRQAKNFLVAYALLKEKRLGKDARLTGANLRSAWAFTLWGDPTIQLPPPTAPATAMAPVRAHVHGNSVIVTLPETYYEKIRTSQYVAQPRPNTCLAGLLTRSEDEKSKVMVPFVFSEVSLPKSAANLTPRLKSKLPSSHYVFVWDARRRCGYLLVTPRPHDEHELKFTIEWELPSPEAARSSVAVED